MSSQHYNRFTIFEVLALVFLSIGFLMSLFLFLSDIPTAASVMRLPDAFRGVYVDPDKSDWFQPLTEAEQNRQQVALPLQPLTGLDQEPTKKESKPAEEVFLLYPRDRTVLTNTQTQDLKESTNEKDSYPVVLRFEVSPKGIPSRIEIKMNDEIVMHKYLPRSPTGLHEVKILIKKAARYRWRVTTKHGNSPTWEFTIRR
jgi:hypothetical protein